MAYQESDVLTHLCRPVAFLTPDLITAPPSWLGHIPFALWIIEALRPRTLVELGTQTGNSYSAFCQAVRHLGLATSCYAVDTWEGDPHTGYYGEEVHRTLTNFHDPRYGAFSRLLRMTFDEAVAHFPAGGIDLLHIDGLHTYEAARHDFETWRTRMSGRGVVLFHDINVRKADFGVWKLWDELSAAYPSCAFLHCNGLGVLGVGADQPAEMAWLFRMGTEEGKRLQMVRAFFDRLGQGIIETQRAHERAVLIAGIEQKAAELNGSIAGLHGELQDARKTIADRDRTVAELHARISEVTTRLDDGLTQLEVLRAEAMAHASAAESLEKRVAAATEDAHRLEATNTHLTQQIAIYETSHSWRLTAPLRAARRWIGRRRLADQEQVAPAGEPSGEAVDAWTDAVQKSGLFDPRWYQDRNSDVVAEGMDPVEHFVRYGSAELRSPGPNFDARWYVHEYPEVFSSGLEPLAHYLTIGRDRGFHPVGDSYLTWCRRFDVLDEEDRAVIRADLGASALPPLCILVYVDETTQSLLEQVTTAIDRQFGSYLQVILILGTECDATVFEVARRVAQVSAKYTVVSRSYVSNEMAPISVGTNIVCLLGAILLREHALYMLARAAASLGAVDLVYSDEDTLDVDGNRCKPIFKPQFSPTLARQLNYIGRCFLVREVDCGPIEIARRLSDGTLTTDQYVESILKRATTIVHVPDVLYHDITPLRAAPKRSIDLIGPGKVLPTFSVIILTRDLVEFLKPCIESIENRTDYPHSKIEIIVVDNGSSDKNTLEYLETLSGDRRATVIRDASRFNYSGLNNAGAAAAKHDVLLFINNDMLVDDPLWLRRIATHVTEHDVAAVGAKLLFPDRRIQHAGVILGIRGVAGHNLVGLDESDPRVRGDMTRELSAVTGACLSIRRDVFNQLGGFDTVTAVAFNDVLLCLAAIKAGYRNVYIKEPLLIHFESRSRGQDNTAKKAAWFGREARYALKRYPEFFRNDPYYSPNLCLQEPNTLAFPPRRSKPWRGTTRDLTRLKILFLSSTHEIGHGVAVVLALQANHLRARGHDVSVGGPKGQAEVSYGDCRRVYLNTPAEAAAVAVEMGIDCIVAETPPFFSVTRWLDQWPRTFCLDYGEPPSEFFPDAAARQKVVAEKQLCFAAASKVAAISRSVRAEGTEERAQVIPLGNSHLIGVKGQSRQQRESMRQRFGWVDKAIILNVCRFTAAERYYKGLTEYEEILQEFRFARPNLAGRTVFVLCGKGTLEDASAMRQCGFEVFPNVSDVEMADLYNAADIYANFSRWEGYNLGIGQALAAGLPVVASDIPAHRAFSVFTSNDTLTTVEKLSELVQTAIEHQFSAERVPTVWDWKHSLEKLEDEIVQLCRT